MVLISELKQGRAGDCELKKADKDLLSASGTQPGNDKSDDKLLIKEVYKVPRETRRERIKSREVNLVPRACNFRLRRLEDAPAMRLSTD